MQQQVADLFFDAFPIVVGDSIGQFIGFLDRKLAQGLDGLLFIPWTFLPQVVHDLDQPGKCISV